MAQYRKKPVVIDAWRFDGSWESASPVVAMSQKIAWSDYGGGRIQIETLEGTMTALPGDWIIKGVKNEFYPCKPDIFWATYEPVTQTNERRGKHELEAKNTALQDDRNAALNSLDKWRKIAEDMNSKIATLEGEIAYWKHGGKA